jgi:hypothetical protein
MYAMAQIHKERKEDEHAVPWYTKAGAYTCPLLSST